MTALWDYENWLPSHYDAKKGTPVGKERLTHPAWVQHVKSDLPMLEWTWEQYVQHVEAGDGGEWCFGQDRLPQDPEWEPERPRAF